MRTAPSRQPQEFRHRHQEFLKFLRRLDRAFPPDLTLHIILDNYGTHKHEAVRKWLAAHPRFKLHFTPTSSSWLNLVESWFSKLTQQRLRRGVFCSVQELVAAIKDYLTHHNANPKPFVWSTTVETILGKIRKCKGPAGGGSKPPCAASVKSRGGKDSDGYKVVNCPRAQPVFDRFGRLARGKVISVTVLRYRATAPRSTVAPAE